MTALAATGVCGSFVTVLAAGCGSPQDLPGEWSGAPLTDEGGHRVVGEAGADGQGHDLPGRGLLTLLRTGAPQAERHAVVALVTGVLKERPLPRRHGDRRCPRLRMSRGIIDRDLIVDGVGVEPREALDDPRRRAGAEGNDPEASADGSVTDAS